MSTALNIEQQAARWILLREQQSWSAEDQVVLDAWLDASMANKAAYWRLDHGWREADRIASLGDTNVPPPIAQVSARHKWMSLMAAAVLLAAFIGGVVRVGWLTRSPVVAARTFSTKTGGHETVPLTDGSKVELNTASSVRTSVTKERREVWLDRGEAYFEIAHLNGLPFVVHAGSRTVTVLGTRFSVRRDGDKVTVSVVEGRVRVEDAVTPDAVPAAIITAGDVAVARGPSTLLAARSEERVLSALAWRDGMIDFNRTSLADAVAEFNRYNDRKIAVADADTAAIRIGGTFQAANVDAFVRLLHDAYGIRVESTSAGIEISR